MQVGAPFLCLPQAEAVGGSRPAFAAARLPNLAAVAIASARVS